MATEKPSAGRQRRRVHRLQNQVLERVNQGLLGDGVVAPKDEDEVLSSFRKGADSRVCELFPAVARVRGGLAGTHRQRGVEEQHPFPRPFLKIARPRHRHAEVGIQLLEDILQTGRKRHAIRYGERKPVRLTRTMIWVLTQNHDLHFVERREVEGVENQRSETTSIPRNRARRTGASVRGTSFHQYSVS